MRYQVTITGTLVTPATEETVRADAPSFLRMVEGVHSGIVAGSVELTTIEALPELVAAREPIPDMDVNAIRAQLATLQRIVDTFDASR